MEFITDWFIANLQKQFNIVLEAMLIYNIFKVEK